jgi:hypothetical protein
MLHCGASNTDLNAIELAEAPEATATYQPYSHTQLINTVKDKLPSHGLEVTEEAYGMNSDGSRFFGMIGVRNYLADDYSWVIGIRNSYDKRLSAGLVAGSKVFVCDNLSFCGDVTVSRKHTKNIVLELPDMIDESLNSLVGSHKLQADRYDAMRDHRMNDAQVNDFVIRSMQAGIINPTMIPKIVKEWHEPRHVDFMPRNTWSLFNTYTEILKGQRLTELATRTEKLHNLADSVTGFDITLN